MNVEKLLLIILFIAISYYPICAIVGFISFIKRDKAESEEEMKQEQLIEIAEKLNQWLDDISDEYQIDKIKLQDIIKQFLIG